MANCTKLIQKARASAANVRFEEAVTLAECLGYELARIKGSHHYFKFEGLQRTVNLQPDKRDSSKAKKRPVEQLLKVYDDMRFQEEA